MNGKFDTTEKGEKIFMIAEEMVSVIIPSYNRQATIIRAVQSVLNQSYANLEVIVVDDCSSDKTVEMVKQIKDDRLRIIECKKNGGACIARNIGIEVAKGEYIAFQDSDDEWFEKKLEIELNTLKATKCDVVACGFYRYMDKKVKQWPFEEVKGDYLERILKKNYVTTQAIVAKRECFEDEKFDEKMPRYQDWELAIRLLQKYKFYFINQPLLNVYVQKDSISTNREAEVIAVKRIIEKHREVYNKYPQSDLMLKKIYAYGKLQDPNCKHNYYADILRDYKFEVKVAIRSIQFELKKLMKR